MDGPANPPRLTKRVMLMGLIYAMGGFVYGYDTGQISGFLEMESFKRSFGVFDSATGTYEFPTTRSGLIVGMLSIGNLFGALAAAPLADQIGRKMPIALACGIYSIGASIQISSHQWYQLVIGRWVGGLGVGALSVLVPLATSETSPTHIRGLIVSGFQMAVTCGILVASLINAGTERLPSTAAWRITMAIDFLWVLLLVEGLPFLPESPKYIYGKGKPETAKAIMARLMGVSDDHSVLQRELQQMAEKLALEQTTHDQPWWLVFRSRNVLTRTLLATGVLSFQQLTGANFFFYYGTTIFAATGLSNSYITQIILAAVNVACTLPGLYFGQKLSHRRCLILGGLWMSVCFILFASIGHFSLDRNDPSRTLPAGRALIAFGTLFVAAFASTWGPMSWGDAAALCPAHCRAICMSVATAVYWIWSFLLAFFTPMITERIDYLYGYVFAGCCFMMALMVYFFLVESQGRTLEEIDTLYLDPERQRWCWKRLWSVKKN